MQFLAKCKTYILTYQNLLYCPVVLTFWLNTCDLSNPARTRTRIRTSIQPAPLSLFFFLYLPLPHSIRLSFAISICSNDIYLASWECPSAIRHNKSYIRPAAVHVIFMERTWQWVMSTVFMVNSLSVSPKWDRTRQLFLTDVQHFWPEPEVLIHVARRSQRQSPIFQIHSSDGRVANLHIPLYLARKKTTKVLTVWKFVWTDFVSLKV